MSKTYGKKTLFAFAKSLASNKNVFKGESQPTKFSEMTSTQKKLAKKKFAGKLGDEYKKQLSKTVKPGKGKFALPSQEPGSKAPTIKPATNTKKVTGKVGGSQGRWQTHVSQVKSKNPDLTYKEVLIEAKKTYQSNTKAKRETIKTQKPLIAKEEAVKKAPKPRKLSVKQMTQRFKKQSVGERSDEEQQSAFEKLYEDQIKGIQFSSNQEIEELISKSAQELNKTVGDRKEEENKLFFNKLAKKVGETGAKIIEDFGVYRQGETFFQSYAQGGFYRGNITEKDQEEIASVYKKLNGYMGKTSAQWLKEYETEGQKLSSGFSTQSDWVNLSKEEREERVKAGGDGGFYEDQTGRGSNETGKRRGGYRLNQKMGTVKFETFHTMLSFGKMIRKNQKKDNKKGV